MDHSLFLTHFFSLSFPPFLHPSLHPPMPLSLLKLLPYCTLLSVSLLHPHPLNMLAFPRPLTPVPFLHAPFSSLSHLCCSFCPALRLSSAGAVRASSIFPILSVILLFMGGLCIAASEFYKTRHNIILSAGIFFVSAGKRGAQGLMPLGWAPATGGLPSQDTGVQFPR